MSRAQLDRAMSEAAWQAQVIELAQLLGWRVAHFRPAPTQSGRWATPVAADGAGFPDLVLVRDRIILAELKTGPGRLKPEQDAWLDALVRAGVECHLWRPSDYEDVRLTLTERRPA